MTRGDALHACTGVAVAVRTGAIGGAGLARPRGPALQHPQRGGIGGVVILHRAGLTAHELVAGPAFPLRDLAGEGRRRQREHDRREEDAAHYSTVIAADSVAEKPPSPVHVNVSVPLSTATVENTMKGFAAIAG